MGGRHRRAGPADQRDGWERGVRSVGTRPVPPAREWLDEGAASLVWTLRAAPVSLRCFTFVPGVFATEPAFANNSPARLLFEASDGPAWQVTFGGPQNVVVTGDLGGTDADAVVRGTSDEHYRWAWNRPASVVTTGDPQTLALWRTVRID